MDTRQLEYFVAVAEELNFTRAALRLFAAQSTVSAGIRSLEQELGAILFDRSTKVVSLTAAGTALMPEAREAIEALDRVRSSVALSAEGIRGRLRIGTFIALDAVRLPQALGEFHERHPLVDLQLIASPSGSTGLTDEVRHGRADVAFIGLPLHDLTGFDVLELARSPFVALLPVAHPLASKRAVELVDLVAERWIDSPLGYASRIIFDRVLAESGLSRVISAQVADPGEIPKLVAAGLGVAGHPGDHLSIRSRGRRATARRHRHRPDPDRDQQTPPDPCRRRLLESAPRLDDQEDGVGRFPPRAAFAMGPARAHAWRVSASAMTTTPER